MSCKYYDDAYCIKDDLDCGYCHLCFYRNDDMTECPEYEEYKDE